MGDVHDQLDPQLKSIHRLLKKLDEEGKEVAFTGWRADGPRSACALKVVDIPLPGHYHLDAGMIIWKPGKARQIARKIRPAYVPAVTQLGKMIHKFPRGSDEVILEQFLSEDWEPIKERALFEKHPVDSIRVLMGKKPKVTVVPIDFGTSLPTDELFVEKEHRPKPKPRPK
eukprot:NODE_1515_length_586_cov_506.411546_g1215_i0.p1 GENE.NODE_1515_length_586_cov_506.411546_g1215_i0~~NODE_1515_length_586_cov_506.411546_g1215_i0.p1  ORF type:complete len:179 (-),score=31.68 NODE_1515_length_586_cov_506.411546_g1215_i0:49-561(-)